MAHIWEDRVLETSTTTGTGALTLAGAVTGFRTFASVCAVADTLFYYVEAVDAGGSPTGDWETGLGTYSSAGVLTRTTVVDSSNAGAAVSFAAGTKRVGLGSAQGFAQRDAAGGVLFPNVATPVTPPADTLALVAQRLVAGGGLVMPRSLGEDGIYQTLQPHLARNSIASAQGNGTNTAPTVIGGGVLTTGTLTARVPASTNRATRALRSGLVSAATAGQAAAFYRGVAPLTLGGAAGGGFMTVLRWIASDAAAVAGAHMFVGVSNLLSTPVVTTNPNTLTNAIGAAQLNGGTNLQLVYGGSAAQTPIDLGANFPAAGLSTDLYELILYSRPDINNAVSYRVERINTGHVASGILTAATPGTQLPANTTMLATRMYRSNNATALAVGIDLVHMYTISDL